MSDNRDDYNLFKDAMHDVKPLKACASSQWLKAPVEKVARRDDLHLDNPLTSGLLDIVPLTMPLEYSAAGIQPGVLEKLYLGKYPPQASLNLIRQSVEQCRQAVYLFMLQAERDGVRNLLIVHGKGRHDGSHANVVRSYLMRWLPQFEQVQAFCAARDRDGGSGACYVALRKSERERLDNRERHARRSR